MAKQIAVLFLFLAFNFAYGQKNKPTAFQVKPIPTPTVYADDYTSKSAVTKKELLALDSLTVRTSSEKSVQTPSGFSIVSFDFSVVLFGSVHIYSNTGAKLNAKIKEVLQNIKSGQKLYFDNIKVKCPDGSTKIVQGLTLLVE